MESEINLDLKLSYQNKRKPTIIINNNKSHIVDTNFVGTVMLHSAHLL